MAFVFFKMHLQFVRILNFNCTTIQSDWLVIRDFHHLNFSSPESSVAHCLSCIRIL